MAKDSSPYVRLAVLAALQADADVSALVGDRVYSVATPSPDWPFIRYGGAITLPRRASHMDGTRLALTLHAFAKDDTGIDGQMQAEMLAAAVVAALDRQGFDLETPWPARLYDIAWTSSQALEDPEVASAFHVVVNMEANVTS